MYNFVTVCQYNNSKYSHPIRFPNALLFSFIHSIVIRSIATHPNMDHLIMIHPTMTHPIKTPPIATHPIVNHSIITHLIVTTAGRVQTGHTSAAVLVSLDAQVVRQVAGRALRTTINITSGCVRMKQCSCSRFHDNRLDQFCSLVTMNISIVSRMFWNCLCARTKRHVDLCANCSIVIDFLD